jgi:hypothetical protein
MAGRPNKMLQEIEEQLKGAVVREIITPGCCFNKCPLRVVGLIHLARANGSHSYFMLCKDHLDDIVNRHPSSLGGALLQTFIVI